MPELATAAKLTNGAISKKHRDTAPPVFSHASRFSALAEPAIQRKASCACGGGCPSCQENTNVKVSQPNDPAEIEADRVADQVMAGQAFGAVGSSLPVIHRRAGSGTATPPTGLASVDEAISVSGSALEPSLRQDMEGRFGHDFSQVRLHTGATAERSAREVNAKAYTIGNNIVFDTGQFAPATHEGRRLLAHELTHVVQQSGERSGLSHAARQIHRQAAGVGTPGGSPPTTIDEWIICLAICACDLAPLPSVSGMQLRQACVSAILLGLDLALSWKSSIKAEVSYDMRKPGAPTPIMDPAIPTRQRSPWGAYNEMIKRYGAYIRGTLRRPDVVLVNDPSLPPEQANIRRVIEIKFPGDTLTAVQQAAYERIAGSPSKFAVFTPTSCGCDAIEDALHKLRLLLELLAIAALMAAIVADDLAGQVEDDPALIPLGARIAVIIEQLTAEAPVLLRATVN